MNKAVLPLLQWREMYPEETRVCKGLRDCADTNKLIVISNLESINAMLLHQGLTDKAERLKILCETAISQLESLDKVRGNLDEIQSPNKKKLTVAQPQPGLSDMNQKLKTALNYNPKAETGE